MFQDLDNWIETSVDNIYEDAVLSEGFSDTIEDSDLCTLTGLCRLVRFMTHHTMDIAPLINKKKSLTSTIDLSDWLDDFKPFGAPSKQGSVVSARLFKKRQVVLKSYKNGFETALRDFIVGSLAGNLIQTNCPFFVYTLGGWRNGAGECCILTDRVHGKVLADVLNKCSKTEFINIFAQILFALESAQREYKFCHYDLHTRNVIINRRTKPTVCSLGLFDYIFSYEKYPVIIDLGMSFIETSDGKTVGPKDLDKFGICNRLRVGYDAFTFLLFAYKEMTDRTIVKKLLRFFGHDMNLSSHVECLEKFTDDKTPGMMFDWILKTFPGVVAVEKKERNTINFHMPESWCSSKLLKKQHAVQVAAVDPRVEKSFIRYQMARHINAHMGHFEKRDEKCGDRVKFDFKTISKPINDLENAALLLIMVRYLGLDKKSTTYSGWARSLVGSPEFRQFIEKQSIANRRWS